MGDKFSFGWYEPPKYTRSTISRYQCFLLVWKQFYKEFFFLLLLALIFVFPYSRNEIKNFVDNWVWYIAYLFLICSFFFYIFLVIAHYIFKNGRWVMIDDTKLICAGQILERKKMRNIKVTPIVYDEQDILCLSCEYEKKVYRWGIAPSDYSSEMKNWCQSL